LLSGPGALTPVIVGGVESFLRVTATGGGVLVDGLAVGSVKVTTHVRVTPSTGVSELCGYVPHSVLGLTELPGNGTMENVNVTADRYQPPQFPGDGEQL
jgi:hypothetical protein